MVIIVMDVFDLIRNSPSGLSPVEIERLLSVSRSTVNRRLREGVEAGQIIARGQGGATRYFDADPLRSVTAYFDEPHTQRKFSTFNESLLSHSDFDLSGIPPISAIKPMEKSDMVKFLVDFSCASSALEGGTYSLLDTKALIEYGEKTEGKPLSDAFLILNHKNAFEYLYFNQSLDANTIKEVHARLAWDHDIEALRKSPHFLPKDECGVIREYKEIDIAHCAYAPPFRPGTHFLARMLNRIIDTSCEIENPIQSAFYLLTRLPYLQPFADANKRTSRVMCNVPLLKAGLPPISFVDFSKRDYLVSIMAFYELGDVRMASKCFTDAYVKSCERLGLLLPVKTDKPRLK
jgi:Fic family protein